MRASNEKVKGDTNITIQQRTGDGGVAPMEDNQANFVMRRF